jgi:transcriptional regulator with XRE-family HTH domain
MLEHARRPRPLLRHIVGHVLRRTRLAQGRTLADVARTARVSVPYLSELERGRKEGSSEVLAAICEALGIELYDLLARAGHDLSAVSAPARRWPTGFGPGPAADPSRPAGASARAASGAGQPARRSGRAADPRDRPARRHQHRRQRSGQHAAGRAAQPSAAPVPARSLTPASPGLSGALRPT